MEGKVAFRKHAAEFCFVCVGIVENFDNFRNNSTVEEYGANGAEALLSQKEKQHRDEYNAHTDTKQMLKTKQPVVGTKNRGHKTPHL